MMTSQFPRTVSLRRARAALVFSLVSGLVCLACLVFFLVIPASPVLLVAPAIGMTCGFGRAFTWSASIRRATSQFPGQMRWRP